MTFDPYHVWLSIPPDEQPPNYYRLLGLRDFEHEDDVISNAADLRMGHLRTFQQGRHAELSQKLLNEISRARTTLLSAEKRIAYDETLQAELNPAEPETEFPQPEEVGAKIAVAKGSGPLNRRGGRPWFTWAIVGTAVVLIVAVASIWRRSADQPDAPGGEPQQADATSAKTEGAGQTGRTAEPPESKPPAAGSGGRKDKSKTDRSGKQDADLKTNSQNKAKAPDAKPLPDGGLTTLTDRWADYRFSPAFIKQQPNTELVAGGIRLDGNVGYAFQAQANVRDIALRARVRWPSGKQTASLLMRKSSKGRYQLAVKGDGTLYVAKQFNNKIKVLWLESWDEIDEAGLQLEFSVTGNMFTVKVGGRQVFRFLDDDLPDGEAVLSSYRGSSVFREVQMRSTAGDAIEDPFPDRLRRGSWTDHRFLPSRAVQVNGARVIHDQALHLKDCTYVLRGSSVQDLSIETEIAHSSGQLSVQLRRGEEHQYGLNYDGKGKLTLLRGQLDKREVLAERQAAKLGKLFLCRFTVRGNTLLVEVNDEEMMRVTDDELLRPGLAALSVSGGESEFRNVRLRVADEQSLAELTPVLAHKVAVPPAAERDAALKKLQDAFPRLKSSAAADNRLAAARMFLFRKNERLAAAELYAALEQTIRSARIGGDGQLMSQAIETLCATFDVDALDRHGMALIAMADEARTEAALASLVELARLFTRRALDRKRFPAAKAVLTAVYAATMRPSGIRFRRYALRQRQSIEAIVAAAEIRKAAQTKLSSNAHDLDANEAVGQWMCFVDSDWREGARHLSLGRSTELVALGKAELEANPDAQKMAALGEKWWRFASAKKLYVRDSAMKRAEHWYRLALPKATPLARQRISKRLLDIAGSIPAPPSARTVIADWVVKCYSEKSRRWLPHPVRKSSFRVESGTMTFSNVDCGHASAQLVFGKKFAGDFHVTFECRGATNCELSVAGGQDVMFRVLTPAAEWSAVVLRRRKNKITALVNGKPAPVKFHNTSNPAFAGWFGLRMWKGETISIRKFNPHLTASRAAAPADVVATFIRGEVKNSVGMRFSEIPAGRFVMGSRSNDSFAGPDESPAHSVFFPTNFYMGTFEVTQQQYETVTGSNPSVRQSSQHPVENVKWSEAVEFCRRLSEMPAEKAAGRVYRLPTEAEWEYACRAGNRMRYPFGSVASPLSDYAWFHGNSSFRTHPVGKRKPNNWGLYDMVGNVAELCSDYYGSSYYQASRAVEPAGPSSGKGRVLRGGSSVTFSSECRSARRTEFPPQAQHEFTGFRVVLEQTVPTSPKPPPSTDKKKRRASRLKGPLVQVPGVKPREVKEGVIAFSNRSHRLTGWPKFLSSGYVMFQGGHKNGNTTRFKVLRAGKVYLVMSGRPNGGGGGGEWQKRIISPQQLAAAGWKPVGKVNFEAHPPCVIFERNCKAGEVFTYSWEKYICPIVVVPKWP